MKEKRNFHDFIFGKGDEAFTRIEIFKIVLAFILIALMSGHTYFDITYGDYEEITDRMIYDSLVCGDVISLFFFGIVCVLKAIQNRKNI